VGYCLALEHRNESDPNPMATQTENHANTERWVLVATILASSMAFIDGSALNVALPALQTDLNIGGAALLWVVNAYSLFLSALILVGGSLGDLYGRKRIFTMGIILFTASSLVCGLSPSIEILIIARAVQGVGGALMVPGSLAILSASVRPEKRGQAIGTWSTFSTLTTLGGPILGGALAQAGLWRAVFFVNLPIALIALYILRRYVPESHDESAPHQLDYPGAALATLGLAGITFGFIQAPELGMTHPLILFTLIGGVLALIAFVVVENRSDHPIVPLKLFKSRTFSGTNALTLFLYAALNGVLFFFSLNLIQIQGYPANLAGYSLLPFSLSLAFLSRRTGALADRIGPRIPLTVGPALAGIGFFVFSLPGLTNGANDYWTTYFPAVVLLGIGMGITVAPLTTAVMGSAPSESTGVASGINNTVARTAGVLAIAILGALALTVFSNMVEMRTASDYPPEMVTALRMETRKLADAQVPAGLSPEMSQNVESIFQMSFIYTFRLICIIGAVLAWISAALAWWLVEPKLVKS
jgi:EmrB/QacA subfamily drug resistance transporter